MGDCFDRRMNGSTSKLWGSWIPSNNIVDSHLTWVGYTYLYTLCFVSVINTKSLISSFRSLTPLQALSTATNSKHLMHSAFKYYDFTLSPLKSYMRIHIMLHGKQKSCAVHRAPNPSSPPGSSRSPAVRSAAVRLQSVCNPSAIRMRCGRDPLRPARPARDAPARDRSARARS